MAVQLLDAGPPSPIARLSDDYLSHCAARGLSWESINNCYGYSLRSIFLPWCAGEGITDVHQLDGRAVDRFTASLLQRRRKDGQPISKASVHSYVRPVRQMLTWAASVGENIEAKPQLPRVPKPVRDVLDQEELDLLENVLQAERDKLIIRIFGDCGLRRSELCRVQAGDIVRSGRQAHLRVLGKGGRVRDVPIPPQLLRRLERYIAGRPRDTDATEVFLSLRRGRFGDYEPLTKRGVYIVVKRAVRRAGLKKRVFPHLLRHSWMTEMLRRGMNPAQLSVIAGASMEVIMSCYAHLNREDAYDAMMRALAARTKHRPTGS